MFIVAVPRFLTPLKDQHVMQNEDASFFCKVHPDKAVVDWSLNGKHISSYDVKTDISNEGNKHSLLLKDVQEEDACIVTATIGETSTNANLFVEGN